MLFSVLYYGDENKYGRWICTGETVKEVGARMGVFLKGEDPNSNLSWAIVR